MQVTRRTDVDDVAFLQFPLVGDPMTNHFVDRTAIKYQIHMLYYRRRKATHVQTDLGY